MEAKVKDPFQVVINCWGSVCGTPVSPLYTFFQASISRVWILFSDERVKEKGREKRMRTVVVSLLSQAPERMITRKNRGFVTSTRRKGKDLGWMIRIEQEVFKEKNHRLF